MPILVITLQKIPATTFKIIPKLLSVAYKVLRDLASPLFPSLLLTNSPSAFIYTFAILYIFSFSSLLWLLTRETWCLFFFFFFGLRSPSLVYLLYILQAAVHTSLKPMLGGPAGSSFSSTISSPLCFLESFILNCDWPSAYLFPHLHCLWRPATMSWSLLNPHIEPCLEHAIWLFIQQMKDWV